MLEASPEYLKPVPVCAYDTDMRKGEILGLTCDRVDLKAGFIRLREADTKTSERRRIPIGRELRDVLQSLPLALVISFPLYAAEGSAFSGSTGFSVRSATNRGTGKTPASCEASQQAQAMSRWLGAYF